GLVELLERRARWIERALGSLALLGAQGARSLGITGHSGSGKTLLARDAARVLRAHGRGAVVVSLEQFRKTEADLSARGGCAGGPPARRRAHPRRARGRAGARGPVPAAPAGARAARPRAAARGGGQRLPAARRRARRPRG